MSKHQPIEREARRKPRLFVTNVTETILEPVVKTIGNRSTLWL